jgi:hypothetical protein
MAANYSAMNNSGLFNIIHISIHIIQILAQYRKNGLINTPIKYIIVLTSRLIKDRLCRRLSVGAVKPSGSNYRSNSTKGTFTVSYMSGYWNESATAYYPLFLEHSPMANIA